MKYIYGFTGSRTGMNNGQKNKIIELINEHWF